MRGGVFGGGRRDEAEPEVVEEFEREGARVWKITGKDIPDLVVGYLGVNHAVEVKTNRAKLKKGQAKCHAEWTGESPVVARTRAQANKWMRMWRDEAERAKPHIGGGADAAIEEMETRTEDTAGKDPEQPA
jgi:Holliday junction resolvase